MTPPGDRLPDLPARGAGDAEAAAKALAAAGRFGEAGRLLLAGLGLGGAWTPVDTARRRLGLAAASYLALGGEASLAADVFLALGDREGALESLRQAGEREAAARLEQDARRGTTPVGELTPRRLEAAGCSELALQAYLQVRQTAEAARLARRLGRADQAAALYAEAGRPFAAAACHVEAGDAARALENLVRVGRDDPEYRAACREAIRLAAPLDGVSLELENLLSAFVRSGPRDDAEAEAFRTLGQLYFKAGLLQDARAAYAKLVEARPGDGESAEVLDAIDRGLGAAAPPAALPDLPELPELPDLARTTASVTRRTGAPKTGGTQGPLFVVGAQVADRYRLNERIGQGGMSVVFRATDFELGEEIALKVFTQMVQDDEADARFKRELRLSRQLAHPNVIRVYDIGLYWGFRYISMELLSGTDMSHRIASSAPLPASEAVDYLVQACAALQAAHEQGIVHRDVKPGNFFITRQGVVKMMDFGIAKLQSAPGLTASGLIAGTPVYMSPEQVSDFSGVTPASDIYGLGVVAYEMLTGSVPFQHPEVMALLMMHMKDPPPPPRTRNPSIPEALERLVLRLLAKQPAERPGSCRELAEELEAIRQRL